MDNTITNTEGVTVQKGHGLKAITPESKKYFDSFVANQPHSQFIQSWSWGDFQQFTGQKIIRLGIKDNNKLVATATFIKKNLPCGGFYYFCPRGPITNLEVRSRKYELLGLMQNKLKECAGVGKLIFLRIEPNFDIFLSGAKKTIDINPQKTLMLDLRSSKDNILHNMHKKTRYNIRLAEKHGVEFFEDPIPRSKESFDAFWKLMTTTRDRDGFRLHNAKYYQNMLKIDQKNIKLFFTRYKGVLTATGIFSFFGDTVTYLHGASSEQHRNVMSSYLLQWKAINMARENSFLYYDFYGIDEQKWPGVTRFKSGYSGQTYSYPGTFDLIFRKGWYLLYKFARKIRRAI